MKRLAKSVLGVFSLAIGLANLAWCAYSIFIQTDVPSQAEAMVRNFLVSQGSPVHYSLTQSEL